jgi:hypothetical protein
MIETDTSLQYDTLQKKVKDVHSVASRENGSGMNTMQIEKINCL